MKNYLKLGMALTCATVLFTGCTNSTSVAVTEQKQEEIKEKIIGVKDEDSKSFVLTNDTDKSIDVVEVKAHEGKEEFSKNMLSNGDVFLSKEIRTIYVPITPAAVEKEEVKEEIKEGNTNKEVEVKEEKNKEEIEEFIDIKFGFKDEEETYVIEKVDVEEIEEAVISADKDKIVISYKDRDDTEVVIPSKDTETKTKEEKENSEIAEKIEEKIVEETKPVEQPTQPTQPTNTESTTKPQTPQTPTKEEKPQAPSHTHKWEAQYTTTVVHHDEVGHYETVLVKEAWQEPDTLMYCTDDGFCTPNFQESLAHAKAMAKETGHGGSSWTTVIEGAYHDADYAQKYVVDKKAYDEEVKKISGYKCSCGATK